jgi:hypothetical protein
LQLPGYFQEDVAVRIRWVGHENPVQKLGCGTDHYYLPEDVGTIFTSEWGGMFQQGNGVHTLHLDFQSQMFFDIQLLWFILVLHAELQQAAVLGFVEMEGLQFLNEFGIIIVLFRKVLQVQ